MINLSSINKSLITSKNDFNSWAEEILELSKVQGGSTLGFDIETNGKIFPDTELAGFSLYNRTLSKACYVPIHHIESNKPYNVFLSDIKSSLQLLFDTSLITVHNGVYDFLLMNKLGYKFNKVFCTYTLANMLQFINLGLKELSLEFGLIKYNEVMTYLKLMGLLGFPEDHYDFSAIDITSSREAFDYAVNDSIFVVHLAEILFNKYYELIGNGNLVRFNLDSQFNTMLLLAETSTSKGYYVDKNYLDVFIKQFGTELESKEKELMDKVRTFMGWAVSEDNTKSISAGV